MTAMKRHAPLVIAWGALMLLVVHGALAASSPSASGQVKPEFARILFTGPERVPFKAAMNGRTLSLTFEKNAPANLGGLRSSLGPYIDSARLTGPRTAVITLKQPYPVRTFVSNKSSGIDLLMIRSGRYQGKPATPAPFKETKLAKAEPKKLSKAEVKAAKEKLAKQKKKAEIAAVKTVVKTPPLSAENPAAEIETAAVPKPAESPPVEPGKIETAAAKPEPEKPKGNNKLPNVKPAEIPKPVATGEGMLVAAETKKTGSVLHFPWNERVAAATFVRGKEVWIVFSRKTPVNLPALKSVLPASVTTLEEVPVEGATVLRLGMTQQPFVSASKPADSYEWAIAIDRRTSPPETPIVVEAKIEPPLKPSLFLPVLEMSDPLRVTHPQTGQTIEVIPVFKPGQGVFPGREFVDASVLRTAQGVAIEKKSDAVQIVKMRNGVKIGASDGIHISPDLPPIDVAALVTQETGAQTFFPYASWAVADDKAFHEREQALRQQISLVPDPEASGYRRQLAELYLGQGMAVEALGVLNLLRTLDPGYYNDNQLAALHGGANFLANRIEEASYDFNEFALEDEEEIDAWKRVIEIMRGNEMKPFHFFEFHQRFEHFYPSEMRRRLALVAADQAIGQADYQLALNIMKTLEVDKLLDPIREYQQFMMGRILAETGQLPKAEDVLGKLIATSNDRSIRARAGFTLSTARYKAGAIDRAELLKELDRLRIVWRGDQLEMSLLELLGDLYINEGKDIEALRTWKELLLAYPGTPNAQAITARMSDTFIRVFDGGEASRMPPVEALAAFYEFKDLIPVGPAGDTTIQNLADRLASVDLLSRAEELLEHQIANRLEKGDRSRVGARLALIYLLDKKPQKAIDTLELTGYGNNDDELKLKRNHLAATAYAKLSDGPTALGILKNDFTAEGKQIKLDIAWDNQDWPGVVDTAEDMLASRKDITAPLNENEAQTLMRLAIAYTFQDDALQLQYLKDYFTPLMANSPQKDAFEFITSDAGPLTAENVAKLSQEMARTKGFLENYSKSVKDAGLSKAVP